MASNYWQECAGCGRSIRANENCPKCHEPKRKTEDEGGER